MTTTTMAAWKRCPPLSTRVTRPGAWLGVALDASMYPDNVGMTNIYCHWPHTPPIVAGPRRRFNASSSCWRTASLQSFGFTPCTSSPPGNPWMSDWTSSPVRRVHHEGSRRGRSFGSGPSLTCGQHASLHRQVRIPDTGRHDPVFEGAEPSFGKAIGRGSGRLYSL